MYVFLFSVTVDGRAPVIGLTAWRHTVTTRSNTTAANDKHQFVSIIQLCGSGLHDLPHSGIRNRHYEGRSGEKRLHGSSKDIFVL